jgi:cyclophilin family peptidyl-prolyl cis-trans isomerase
MSWKRRFCMVVAMLVAAGLIGGQKPAFASQIEKLELAQLAKQSEAIVLAQVVKVEKRAAEGSGQGVFDEVTIKTASVLKGKVAQNELKVTLQPRGVKGFDPALKAGDIGVFFLKEIKGLRAKLAYWGSVAVFGKPNFVVSEEPEIAGGKVTMVKIETSLGDMVVELNAEAAPVTVENFLQYVKDGFYDGTVFHRVIPNFMIQGGGFDVEMVQKKTREQIVNEAKNGLKNLRGTLTMARTNDPDSATAQFFINHKDNDFLNYAGEQKPGYAVFGKVVEGMEVVDEIASVKTGVKPGTMRGRKVPMKDVPVETVVITSIKVVEDN